MIASLAGKVAERYPPFIVLEIGGVGYEVQIPLSSIAQINVGQSIKLYVHQIIRDDGHFIFGFVSKEQQEWFKLLIKVNGLGPKLAMAVISVMRPIELLECIYSDNYKLLTKIPGIGNKVAQRLVVELKDKTKTFSDMLVSGQELIAASAGQGLLTPCGQINGNVAVQEAVSALVNLGYKPQQAQQAVSKIKNAESSSCEELIREVLKLNVTHINRTF